MDGISQVAKSSLFESAVHRVTKEKKNYIYFSFFSLILLCKRHLLRLVLEPSCPGLPGGRCPVHRLWQIIRGVSSAMNGAVHIRYPLNQWKRLVKFPSTDHTQGINVWFFFEANFDLV